MAGSNLLFKTFDNDSNAAQAFAEIQEKNSISLSPFCAQFGRRRGGSLFKPFLYVHTWL
jgi:hypothetical protein